MADNDAPRSQLDFYFSDANLRRDRFLKSLTGTLGTGAVPVDTLTKFNRVLALAADEAVVVAPLRSIPALEVSADGATVCRRRPLPVEDDGDARTVHVEPVAAGSTIESVQQIFARCGTVAFVSLPRQPSRALRGFGFVEYASEAAARRAARELNGVAPAEGQAALRVTLQSDWNRRKRQREGSLGAAEEAGASDEADEEAPGIVLIRGIGRGSGVSVKATRREIGEACRRVTSRVEFVDYGISNSGDPTVAYVRLKTAAFAADVVRVLGQQEQQLGGKRVVLQVLRGAPRERYLQLIGQLREESKEQRKKKRETWWKRKWGGGGTEAPVDGAAGTGGDASGGEGRSDDAAADGADGSDARKRQRTAAASAGDGAHEPTAGPA
jgi:hypothetical protein